MDVMRLSTNRLLRSSSEYVLSRWFKRARRDSYKSSGSVIGLRYFDVINAWALDMFSFVT